MIRFRHWNSRSHPLDTGCQDHRVLFLFFSSPSSFFFVSFAEKHFSWWKILIVFYTKRAKALIICFNTSTGRWHITKPSQTDVLKTLFCQILPCIYDVRILLHYSFSLFSHEDRCDPCPSLWMQMVVESPFHHSKSFP